MGSSSSSSSSSCSSSSSSSSNPSTDYHSNWTYTGCCDCSAHFYEVSEMEWKTHSMGELLLAASAVLGELRLSGARKPSEMPKMDFTHEAVRLFIHCRKCGRDMDLTCEFSKSGK